MQLKSIASSSTAKEAFEQQMKAFTELSAQLNERMAQFQQQAEAKPDNWGYAGSVAHVNAQMREIIEFIGG
jgi:hypothetical protein